MIHVLHSEHHNSLWPTKDLAVIHSLIDGYTQFYSVYRSNLPLRFNKVYNDSINDAKLIASHHTCALYEQQITVHLRSTLWTLFLPVTVQQQVSDSFRSYAMQVRTIVVLISIC